MVSSSLQDHLQNFLTEQLSLAITSLDLSLVSGGSINETYRLLVNKKHRFFCKINSAGRFPQMFEKEKNGLELLASYKVIRIPQVFGSFYAEDKQILLLEWIEQGTRSDRFWNMFGEQLAAMHGITNKDAGLDEDNYMGALAQSNKKSSDWINFFVHQRLHPQIRIAMDKQLLSTQHEKQFAGLYKALPDVFPTESFSLLHGDLWSGNFLCDHSGKPVLIDPAVYYGHRSMDLAMTTLFGGFDPVFYKAYNEALPFPKDHRRQWEVCNLYPLLIHLNLFGRSYLQNIVAIIQYY